MSLSVDNPILNNLFEEPKEYWIYEDGNRKKFEITDLRLKTANTKGHATL